MGPIPGDGSPGVVLASPGAPLAVWQLPTVLPPRDWGRIRQLMRTGPPAALTLWERQLSFQMEESKIGNEWKMNFFWGCQWLEEGSWTGRASADYTLCVYQGGNLAKCTGADVMVTDHTCCLNRIWILDGVIFDSIWVLTSLVLEVEILRLIPIYMQDFNPIRVWEIWSWALVCWEDNKYRVSVRKKREQWSDAWKMFLLLLESFSTSPFSSISLELSSGPGSTACMAVPPGFSEPMATVTWHTFRVPLCNLIQMACPVASAQIAAK